MRILLAGFLLCGLLTGHTLQAAELLFEPKTDSETGLKPALENWRSGRLGQQWWPWSVTAWDQNGDGRMDCLVTTHSTAGSALFRQEPDGTFVDVTEQLGVKYTDLPNQMRPVLIDIDGDGRLDLVPSNESFALPIVFNRGDKLELGPKIGNLRSRFGTALDLNGDGKIDFRQRLRSYGKTIEYEWLNTGKTLTPTKKLLPIPEDLPTILAARLAALEKEDPAYVPPKGSAEAQNFTKYPANGPNRYCGPDYERSDWNGDGHPDCVLQYFGSYGYDAAHRFGAYLLGDAQGALRDVTATCGIPANLIPLFPLRDLTGDGRVDVLAAFNKDAGLYVQKPDGTFERQPNQDLSAFLAVSNGSYLYGFRTIDFDRDGDDDLFVTQYRLGQLEIYENRGAGNFVRVLRAGHWDAEGFEIADLDGDGLPDLVTGGPPPGGAWGGGDRHSDSQMTLWLNRTRISSAAREAIQSTEPVASAQESPATTEPPSNANRETNPPVKPRARRLRVRIPGVYEGVIEVLEELPPDRASETTPESPEPPAAKEETVPAATPAPQPTASPVVPPLDGKLRHPLESANPASPAARTFLDWIDLNMKRSQYGYSRFDGALAYKLTGNAKYADLAAKGISVQAAKDAVAKGKAPGIANDSYLHVGNQIEDIVFVLAWCGERVPAETKAELEDFCRQAIYNVWNPTQATWYGKPFRWSGWSINNPGNNYHYSFLKATVCWALYAQDKQWLDFLRQEKLPKLVARMESLHEGGSQEGTGYGTAHSSLFGIYALWKANTGEDLSILNTHCRNSLEYWTHAIQPGGKFYAPIGDQAREANAPMYDYQRNLLLRAASLYSDTPEARHARFALLNYPAMRQAFNYVDDLWPSPLTAEEPNELSYAAKGVGHYFARSSWKSDATAVTWQARSIKEGHMAHSLGHFDFWGAGGWLCSTNNIRSKSGIQQTTDWQNLVVLRDATGKLIPQDRDALLTPDVSDDQKTWRASVDLAPTYKLPGLAWRRELTFERPHKLTVHDTCTAPEGISTTWQINVPVQPTIAGNVVTAGKLRVTVQQPAAATIEAKDWIEAARRPDGSTAAKGGWRIEVTGGTEYLVTLEVLP